MGMYANKHAYPHKLTALTAPALDVLTMPTCAMQAAHAAAGPAAAAFMHQQHAALAPPLPKQVIYSTLHNFVRTGQMRLPFQPQQAAAPALALSMPDELRIRDRTTILARHLYSEQGPAFADRQVRFALASTGAGSITLSL